MIDKTTRLVDAIRTIVKTEHGRKFLKWLIVDRCEVFSARYPENMNEAGSIAALRGLGCHLFNRLRSSKCDMRFLFDQDEQTINYTNDYLEYKDE
jgi:hypothetical protein